MNQMKIIVITMLCLCCMSVSCAAGNVDGSKSLICAVIEIHECKSNNDCEEVTIEEINFAQFLMIDFKKNIISGTRADGEKLTTPIKSQVSMNGMLILQGVENGKGWTMSISEKTGNAVLTVSGDAEGFVAFGACIPK